MAFRYNPFTGELDRVLGPGSGTASVEFETDSGTVNPNASGLVNLNGGTGISTSGSGNTATIDLDTPVAETNGGTGQSTYTTGDILYASAANTLSKLAVGSNGEVLTLAAGVPSWAAAGGAMPSQTLNYRASDFDALETNFAPLVQDNGTNNRMMVRAFDDTTEEFVNFSFPVPGEIDTSGTVTFRAFVYAATAVASRFVQLSFNHVPLTSNESWDAAGTDENSGDIALSGTQDQITVASWTETVSNLGWAADDIIIARLSRIAPSGTDLTGDLYLIGFEIEIPRA